MWVGGSFSYHKIESMEGDQVDVLFESLFSTLLITKLLCATTTSHGYSQLRACLALTAPSIISLITTTEVWVYKSEKAGIKV